jgi:phospholipase/lecithinase/hemolysin
VKNLYQFTLGLCLLATTVFPASAGFSSLYVFGDALSASEDLNTVNPPPGAPYYYGLRWSNGRVWVEVLAQRQGLTLYNSNNSSYYDHNSSLTLTDVKNFSAPADVTNALFVVWVCNADTFDSAQVDNPPLNSAQWSANNDVSQANYFQIITNLYAKGVRTLILPNAVDISRIPDFNQAPAANVMRNGCLDFNLKFSNTISQARTSCTNLTIYAPDFFTLLNNALTNAAYYGLTNALQNGYSIDAYSDPSLSNLNISNGIGPAYVFWDRDNPTARFHAVIADEVQKLLPQTARISQITPASGGCKLVVTNWPVGLNGFVEGATNLALTNWTANLVSFTGTNTTPSVFVPASGPQWFYRLLIPYYPYTWSWP